MKNRKIDILVKSGVAYSFGVQKGFEIKSAGSLVAKGTTVEDNDAFYSVLKQNSNKEVSSFYSCLKRFLVQFFNSKLCKFHK